MWKHMAYKFRIYPTKEQETLIAKTIGCSRFVSSHFFKKQNERPRFKSKRHPVQSYNTTIEKKNQLPEVSIAGSKLKLPKLKWVRFADSRNYQKQKRKVARIHEKIANKRTDFLHKVSTEIAKNHDVIGIETLQVKNMQKNRKWSKSISDVSWSAFFRMLAYKADWYGKTVVKVSKTFDSSQLCSGCGHQHQDVKHLGLREWTCPGCGVHHARDVNAGLNLTQEAERLLASSTGRTTGLA